MLSAEGFTNLVNMDGGFIGKMDPGTGQVIVPGWRACGFPESMTPHPERTWDALKRSE